MPGKILIADPVATNRIILKVMLSAGHFDVSQASSLEEAVHLTTQLRPDLILISDTLGGGDCCAVIARLRRLPGMSGVPIAVQVDTDSSAETRRRLLTCADEVIPRPSNNALVLARLRGLLHRQNNLHDLRVQVASGDPAAPHGFAEDRPALDTPGQVALLAPDAVSATRLKAQLGTRLSHQLRTLDTAHPFSSLTDRDRPDVVVLYVPDTARDTGLKMLAELRSAPVTRHANIIAILDPDAEATAIRMLDAGLSDVIIGPSNLEELTIRIDNLVRHAQSLEALRGRLHEGFRAAIIDPLTGLYNRRFAMPFLEQLTDPALAPAGSFAVMLVDIDHFKRVNDHFGHVVGDQVLSHVAERLRGALRREDMIARIGGEEFLLVMPAVSEHQARATAARLCAMVAQSPIAVAGLREQVRVTISIGVVMDHTGPHGNPHPGDNPPGRDATALLDMADRALYASKADGRNTVTFTARPAA